MADARSLLKAQRSTRRITHPDASYTDSGRLSCNLCGFSIKTESLWPSHLKGAAHMDKSASKRERQDGVNTKKRKAHDEDDEDARKKSKAPEDTMDGDTSPDQAEVEADPSVARDAAVDSSSVVDNPATIKQSTASVPNGLTEDEQADFLAFQQELDAGESSMAARAPIISVEATISAAPVTAEELAVQAREDQSKQRDDKAALLEAEKEDAALALEDEFEQMEDLEARLRRLREKREGLRHGSNVVTVTGSSAPTDDAAEDHGSGRMQIKGEDDDEFDDDDDDDELDVWNFGAS